MLAAALLALPCGAPAQDTDARLRAVESELEQLKKRLDVLEGRQPAAAAPAVAPAVAAPTVAPAPADCPGMGQLKMSMTQAQVRGLLGEPARVETTPLQTTWRYACGSAYFDADTRLFVGFEGAR